MNLSDFKVNLPYPEVCGCISSETLGRLMDSYGGRGSETTAIMQYSYQSYVLKREQEELSKTIEGIGIVEMRHHELLSSAIIAFNGDPIIAGRYSFFSGSYVQYIKNPIAILKADIVAEKQAIEEYRRIIACTDNDSLKELIARIIMDEELHISIFERELSTLNCRGI